MSRADLPSGQIWLAPGHHLFRGSDGVWRCAAPGDRFLRLRGPESRLHRAQQVLHSGPVNSDSPEGLDVPFLDGLAERGMLAARPAGADLTDRRVGLEGDGPIAEMVANLLRPLATVVPGPLDPATLAGFDVAVSCAGWLPDSRWRQVDRWCDQYGVAWHRCYGEGECFYLGPLLVPERTASYADIRARRLAAARFPDELRGLWAYLEGGGPLPPVPWPDPGGVAVLAGMLVADVLAYLSGRPIPGADHEIELDPATLGVTWRAALPLPASHANGHPACGRVPVSALVDPRLGLITRVMREPPVAGVPRAFVDVTAEVAATGQFASWIADPVTGGAALGDPTRARAAAIGEAVERYCGNAVPDHLPVGSAESFRADGHRVLDLIALALYSNAQYAQRGFPFVPMTPELNLSWAPGRDLHTGEEVLVPAALAYLNLHRTRPAEPAILCQAYAGIAAGDSLEQAEGSALAEIIERDAVTIWWSSAAEAAVIEVAGEPVLAPVLADARAGGLEVSLLRVPCAFEVPVVGAFVNDPARRVVGFGSACRPTPVAAAEKALAEALVTYTNARALAEPDSAFWTGVRAGQLAQTPYRPWRADHGYRAMFRADWRDMTVLDVNLQLYLDPVMQGEPLRRLRAPRGRDRLSALPSVCGDARTGYLDQLRAHNLSAVSVDLTTSDVAATGLRVVRVVVPGLYHNAPAAFPLLGGRRLYSEPLTRRWIEQPFTERDVVRHPLPFA
jgi:ribosomal protein S12 methylthiotransferase accessory factor